MNCGYTYTNSCFTPTYYTMAGSYNNNGWCTLLVVIFIIFIICGLSKSL